MRNNIDINNIDNKNESDYNDYIKIVFENLEKFFYSDIFYLNI